jgi:dolichol-phosphate mannosyltransferase
MPVSFGIVITMANEMDSFTLFIERLKKVIDNYSMSSVFIITDGASKDETPQACAALAKKDSRFTHEHNTTVKNIVQAKMRCFAMACMQPVDYILEIDAGLSHKPEEIALFVQQMEAGVDCIYGSRFCKGGNMDHDSSSRKFLSSGGTLLTNLLLGTRLKDMTSGFQAFKKDIVMRMLTYPFKSIAHFHQTEMRYLLRHYTQVEVPIHYTAPSPNVSKKSIKNAINSLLYYFYKRITFSAKRI